MLWGGKLGCGAGGSPPLYPQEGREELRNAFLLHISCRFLLLNCFLEKPEKSQPQPVQGYFLTPNLRLCSGDESPAHQEKAGDSLQWCAAQGE